MITSLDITNNLVLIIVIIIILAIFGAILLNWFGNKKDREGWS